MEHFYNEVYGWFGNTELPLYKEVVDRVEEKAHFVEVGSFKGKSSVMMAVLIINSGKDIKFDCVDTWLGSEEHQKGAWCADVDVMEGTLYERFLKNIEPVKDFIEPVRKSSVEAAKDYEDESLDFVFIDAAHDEESVFSDLTAWYPKIKSNGIIAGHDYNPNSEATGVAKAVKRYFENKSDEVSWRNKNFEPYCGCFFLVRNK